MSDSKTTDLGLHSDAPWCCAGCGYPPDACGCTTQTTAGEFYARRGDPLSPVYEIDRERNEVRLAGSKIGGGLIYPLRDNGSIFLTEKFQRVSPVRTDGGVTTYAPYQEQTP